MHQLPSSAERIMCMGDEFRLVFLRHSNEFQEFRAGSRRAQETAYYTPNDLKKRPKEPPNWTGNPLVGKPPVGETRVARVDLSAGAVS